MDECDILWTSRMRAFQQRNPDQIKLMDAGEKADFFRCIYIDGCIQIPHCSHSTVMNLAKLDLIPHSHRSFFFNTAVLFFFIINFQMLLLESDLRRNSNTSLHLYL